LEFGILQVQVEIYNDRQHKEGSTDLLMKFLFGLHTTKRNWRGGRQELKHRRLCQLPMETGVGGARNISFLGGREWQQENLQD
jgi:hypothetical protein